MGAKVEHGIKEIPSAARIEDLGGELLPPPSVGGYSVAESTQHAPDVRVDGRSGGFANVTHEECRCRVRTNAV
jgi:hypothetical protein